METTWIYNGDFTVTEDMVLNGKMIEDMIPRKVTGCFYCSGLELTSLKGCPKSVSGYFDCDNNELTSLEGCPESVGESFYCTHNKLLSLEGCPSKVGGSFWCYNNNLTTLEGGPKNFSNEIFANGLETEKDFIESGGYINEYWKDLLKYMISNHINLTKVKGWPKDFLTNNIIRSAKGINKFQL